MSKNRRIIETPKKKSSIVEEEDDSDPADPDLSSSDKEIVIKPKRRIVLNKAISSDSLETQKRAAMAP